MRPVIAVTLLSALSATALAAPPDAPNRTFQGRDLFALQMATDPQIRPDGREIAYVRVAYDIMADRGRQAIWLVDAESGEQRPLVSAGSQPRWSPSADRIAYVAGADGGRPQLFVRWLGTAQTAKITDLTDAPGNLKWSPDGKWIAFTMFAPDEKARLGEAPPKPEGADWAPPLELVTNMIYRSDAEGYLKPGYTHIYVVSADGGAPRQLTFGAYNEDGPISWTPDGKYVVVTGNRREQWERQVNNSEVYRIALADGSIETLTQRNGPDRAADISPDGKTIAYLGYEDQYLGYQNVELSVMGLDGGNSRSLTASLDRTIDDATWSHDGRSLYVQYDDHANVKVARLALNGKMETVAEGLGGGSLDRPYTGGQFSVANNGAVAFTKASAQQPTEIAIARGGKVRQLTHLNDGFLGGKTLGQVKPLKVTSSFDQRDIAAWIVTPPNFDSTKKYPLILEIHGGPFTAYGPQFSTDYQLYAAAGYAVLYTNPRGSTSYGAEFANLIHHNYPSQDYDDLMSAVDAAIAQGNVDGDNLFVTGGSGGGVLTAWIVGKTTRFKAAVSQKPVINWVSEVLTTDVAPFMPKYWFGKMPWEDPQAYWKRSPLSLVGAVKTPTLVLVGDRDYRTPVSDAEQYYAALQLAGVPTGLVKVPGASHGGLTARPSQSAAKASAILAWFERYRGKPNVATTTTTATGN